MKIHNQIIKVIISMIVVIGTIIGVSYAYFTTNINVTGNDNIIATTKDFTVTLVENSRTSGLLIPINDNDYLIKAADSYFNVNATSGNSIAFSLNYEITFESAINNYSAFKWTLTDGYGLVIDQGSLTECEVSDNITLACTLSNRVLQTESSKNYHLYFWLSDDGTNQNEFIGNNVVSKMVIKAAIN